MANKKFLSLVLAALATSVAAAPFGAANSTMTYDQTVIRASDIDAVAPNTNVGETNMAELNVGATEIDSQTEPTTDAAAFPSEYDHVERERERGYGEHERTEVGRHEGHFEEYEGRRHYEHSDEDDDEEEYGHRTRPSPHSPPPYHPPPSHGGEPERERWNSFEEWNEEHRNKELRGLERDHKFDSFESWEAARAREIRDKEHSEHAEHYDHFEHGDADGRDREWSPSQPHHSSPSSSHRPAPTHARYPAPPYEGSSRHHSVPEDLSYDEWEDKHGQRAYEEFMEEHGQSRSHHSSRTHEELDRDLHAGEFERERMGAADERGEHWEHWEHRARHDEDDEPAHHAPAPPHPSPSSPHSSSRYPYSSRTIPVPYPTETPCDPEDFPYLDMNVNMNVQKRSVDSQHLSKHTLASSH